MTYHKEQEKLFENLLLESRKILQSVEGQKLSASPLSVSISPIVQEVIENINIALSVITNGSQDTFIRFGAINRTVDAGYWDIPIVLSDPLNPANKANWTDDFRNLLGFSDEKDFPNTIGSWTSRIHPDDLHSVYRAFSAHMIDFSGKSPYDIEYRFRVKSGEYYWFRGLSNMIKNERGIPSRVSGVMYNIHAQKIKEKERQEVLSRFNLISTAIEEGSWAFDLSSVGSDFLNPNNQVWWSSQYRKLMGYQKEYEFPNILKSWIDSIYPSDKERVFEALLAHLNDHSSATPFVLDYRMRLKSGIYHWFHCEMQTERNAQGLPIYTAGIIRNIDDMKAPKLPLSTKADLGRIPTVEAVLNFDGADTMIIGQDTTFLSMLSKASIAAKTDVPILIYGENGVGKELFAKVIHENSTRKNKSLISVNCAAVPEHLIESELFGYEDGAFTGARHGGQKGKFEIADGGSIFLDEISDMSLSMQAKILRAIQEKEIEKIGRSKKIQVDIRIITATNKSLIELIEQNKFRIDLFYRLNLVQLVIPPLRERGEDVLLLAEHFLIRYNRLYRKNLFFSGEILHFFMQYTWPGNVRELQNCVEYMVIMCPHGKIGPEHLPMHIVSEAPNHEKLVSHVTLKQNIRSTEKEMFKDALSTCKNKSEAMARLGISKRTFYKKLKEYDLL